MVLGNQPEELLLEVAADFHQIADHHPFPLAGSFS